MDTVSAALADISRLLLAVISDPSWLDTASTLSQ